jgi:hypothetical protein
MIKIYQEEKPLEDLNQTSLHLGESNLFIVAGVQVVYGMGNPGDVTPDARPARHRRSRQCGEAGDSSGARVYLDRKEASSLSRPAARA